MERNLFMLGVVAVSVALITAACPGPPGPPGVSGYQIVVAESPVNSAVSKQVSDTCPTGKKALGAGWGVLASTSAIQDATGRVQHTPACPEGLLPRRARVAHLLRAF